MTTAGPMLETLTEPLRERLVTALCTAETGAACPGGDVCERRHARLLRPLRAAADGDVAVARVDGALAGFVRLERSTDAGHALVEVTGQVFPPWRHRGAGSRLIDWSLDRAAAGAGGTVEVLVDVVDDHEPLGPVLVTRGFAPVSAFTELTRPLRPPLLPAGVPTALVTALTEADHDAVGQLYTEIFAGDPHAGRGRAAIAAALAHPGLRPGASRVARSAGGELLAYLLTVTWPGDPADLWIETIGLRPAARGLDLVRRMIADITRRPPADAATISIGVPHRRDEAAITGYEELGFTVSGGWERYSLLLF
ncbi:GNAT family N-acetyltransferase [Actinoplanes sp. CA-051413]|uniref:GNAT family N-acetyltransferase n=1 Tax=Actinoplanes sp. CA-051413 TaxID=3239899 RepID=UPI003D9767B5